MEGLSEQRISCPTEEKDAYLYYLLLCNPGRTLVRHTWTKRQRRTRRRALGTVSPFSRPRLAVCRSLSTPLTASGG